MSNTPPPIGSAAEREALREVFARMKATRPHWPATFEAASADAIILRVLRLTLRYPPDAARRSIESARFGLSNIPPAPQHVADDEESQREAFRPLKRQLDGKQRASGEKDDDPI